MNKQDLTRFPQNLNFNPDMIDKVFEEDANLIRDISVLASHRYNQNLFGHIELTITDFEKLGYNRTELQRRHPKFRHLSKEDIEKIKEEYQERTAMDINFDLNNEGNYPFLKDHLCISRLDYAFYKAYKTTFHLSRRKENSVFTTKLDILNNLAIHNTNKKSKRVYQFTLSSAWVQELFKAYNLISIDQYIQFGLDVKSDRAGSFKNFYLFMGRMISKALELQRKGQEPIYTITVDDVCRISNNRIKSDKKRKEFVTTFLREFHSKSRIQFGWKYVPTTPSSNAKYGIRFTFGREIELFDEGKRAVLLKELIEMAKQKFTSTELKNDISKIGTLTDDDFFKWWISDRDMDIKNELVNYVSTKYNPAQPVQIKKTKKRSYISIQTLEELARTKKQSIEQIAKESGYIKDEKGDYYKIIEVTL